MISEIGFPGPKLNIPKPRKRVKPKIILYLYDLAMLGFVNHSKIPCGWRFIGFGMSVVSFLIAVAYLVLKLLFWSKYQVGFASLVIGIFFFSSVQLFFIGVLGEYVGAIHTQVRRRPLVIEKERINFD